MASFPLAHNLYYGKALVPLTQSAGIPSNLVIAPTAAAAALSDPGARQILMTQPGWLLVFDGDRYLQWMARGSQAAWIATIIWLLRRRRWSGALWLLASVPALFLGVHVFFQVTVYYPRHIVAGHLAMVLVAMAVLRLGDRAVEESVRV